MKKNNPVLFFVQFYCPAESAAIFKPTSSAYFSETKLPKEQPVSKI